jgi:aminoglycoside phosphotransferase (APT) family kinase protein
VGTPDPAPPELAAFLRQQGLAGDGEPMRCTPLAGGVSSDIWRIDLPRRSVCVKRALPKLRVGADWFAPVSRNRYEWEWLKLAAAIVPAAVPRPLAHDEELGLFAMEFLPPEQYPLWKRQLLDGQVDADTAVQLGRLLAAIHNATAGRPEVARTFDSEANFHALRLEPYLLATAERHRDLAPVLHALARRTGAARIALVHGDVSPKNILVGPQGPVLLDAECAWYGDPAFDIAFCLNHLLLKAVLRPQQAPSFMDAFDALAASYFETADFEPCAGLERRAAALLPGLALARIDGKSPVEYLLDRPLQQALVRRETRALLLQPPASTTAISARWRSAVSWTTNGSGTPFAAGSA